MNDVYIAGGIALFFLLSALVIPFANSIGGAEADQFSGSAVGSDMAEKVAEGSTVNIWDVVKSLALIGLWTFGGVPAWLDLLLYEPLRIMLYFIIARNVWIGGGG